MISVDLARRLRDAGLVWHPASGDAFSIESAELGGEVFTVSDMTIEAHEFDTGTILGFNGTTEWALDSVAIENALWLPREEQLRALLGSAFRSLAHIGGVYRCEVLLPGASAHDASRRGELAHFDASDDAAEAYALALLALLAAR
jgi:hypothetical protein